jgi:hypothetical protein
MRSGSLLINALFPACLLCRQAGLVVDQAGLWAGRAPAKDHHGVVVLHLSLAAHSAANKRPRAQAGGARPPIEALVLYIIITLIDYLVSHLL